MRWELENLAFKFLEPAAYEALAKKIRQRRKGREREILEMQRALEEALAEAGIPAAVSGRPKHMWSIHRKIAGQGRPYEETPANDQPHSTTPVDSQAKWSDSGRSSHSFRVCALMSFSETIGSSRGQSMPNAGSFQRTPDSPSLL